MHPETTKPLPSRVPSSLPPVRTLSFWLVLLPLLGLLTMLLPAGAPTEASPAAITERISVDSQGGQADAGSGPPVISGDGRYVAFESSATNLVLGDTNGVLDVFRRDVVTGETLRVSENSIGGGSNDFSRSPDISDDGQAIAFEFSVSLAAISHQDILGLAITGFAIKGFLDVDNLGLFEGGNTCPKLGKTTSPGGRRVVYYADAESGAQGAGLYVEGLDTGIVIHTGFKPDDTCQLTFSADGRRVIFASAGFLQVWDLMANEVTPLHSDG